MSRQRSLEQDRAKAAWDRVLEAKNQPYAGKYGQLARSAPADIQANGLGQTLAFWWAKGNEHARLLDDVSKWVMKQLKASHEHGLLGWIMAEGTTTDGYRRATTEAIAFLTWLKRFAEAELLKGEGG